jgi:catechol 2,3-dioxygenase-like lactoylglutathione lyase family enzyme
MKTWAIFATATLGLVFAVVSQTQPEGQTSQLPTPGFHHLHLNSPDPDRAIDFYTKQFPSTSKSTWDVFPALKTGKVFVLFTKVNSSAPTEPQTAIWHFGWHVVDVRKNLATYQQNKVPLLPLFTAPEGGQVLISSDTWPGTDGTLGRTNAQIAEAKANGVKPAGGGGFAYMQGPDGAIVEYQGNMPAERFNHVHMYQEDPLCAVLWYQKHLNARPNGNAPLPTETNCKVERSEGSWPALEREGTRRKPSGDITFDDVSVQWYARQGDAPLVSTRGHLVDHFALSVTTLDAWIAKLGSEGVRFLGQETELGDGRQRIEGLGRPYKLGDTRAVMIEGPSREAIELVEVK